MSKRDRSFVVGLTGGVATGKSALAAILRREGATVYSLDEVAHLLYRPGTALNRALVRMFGRRVSGRGGAINREELGRIVFSAPGELARLNALVHPPLRREALRAIRDFRAHGGLVVVEAGPILVSLGLLGRVDLAVMATCVRRQRLERLVEGRGLTPFRARALLAGTAETERRLAGSFGRLGRGMVADTGGGPGRLEALAGVIISRSERGHRIP